MNPRVWVAKQIIQASQHTPFRGRGSYGSAAEHPGTSATPYLHASIEASRAADFFNFFPGNDLQARMRGADVLDFGCGYGGRTVEYATTYGAGTVVGVEPFELPVRIASGYAEHRKARNVEFRLCTQTDIPLPDESVDLVLSYDVLEHVDDPTCSMAEIRRVLRPGGFAYLVFPVYFGALSHHLDYISLVPGLHWIFSADTLVQAVNGILEHGGMSRFGASRQPAPGISFDGRRKVLPTLNGLGGEHLRNLTSGLNPRTIARHGWIRRRRPPSRMMRILTSSRMPTRLLDAITSSISCIAQKPDCARVATS